MDRKSQRAPIAFANIPQLSSISSVDESSSSISERAIPSTQKMLGRPRVPGMITGESQFSDDEDKIRGAIKRPNNLRSNLNIVG